ncbi:hypothetical protein ASE63_15555 [Bosea sp. Root381]|uniref:hypothetical protein n=1 Tax=Bosea sp. Root381 TaxID=1736524 RepID=UPI0006FFB785|nr:hypothetical protein [Bosea sp. Root381]KRE16620.1 hypothetical protein ASE63_15555 [Bosea sp. Root381]
MSAFAGPIGALIGLVVGMLQYRIVSGVVVGALRRTDRSQTEPERADYARRIERMKVVLAVVIVGSTTIMGYLIGRMLLG